jgi:sigma-B regulation protein RsbU (phosphoserine phosphatase)
MSDDRPISEEIQRLSRRVRRLEAIVEASALVNSSLDLKEIAHRIILIAADLVGAERGSLFVLDSATGRLNALVAQGIDTHRLSVAVGEGIVGIVAETETPVLLDDPYTDPRFDPSIDQQTGFVTRSLLTVPVRDRDDKLVAVLQLLNHATGRFSGEDVAFLHELGISFAVALTTARLHREIVAQERMEEELRLAAEIQRALQPPDVSSIPGLDLAALTRPCREVGGDCWDVVGSDDASRWWLMVADVSGKGVGAGLVASNVQAYIRSRRNDRRSLARVVAEGNDLLFGLTRGRSFATLAIVEWQPDRRALTWVSAGHPPMLVSTSSGVAQYGATGRPIGLLPNQHYGFGSLQLDPDDSFSLFTDGLAEAGWDRPRGEFGTTSLERHMDKAPAESVAAIQRALDHHLDGIEPDDDITLLMARCVTS